MSLTVHEFAHAWTANYYGDPTARLQGRLTLNPIKHLDPIGTLLMLFTYFGFARPVPVNFNRVGRWGMLAVAAAGPISNLLVALLSVLLLRLFGNTPEVTSGILILFSINVVLAVFNLIPIPLLDGSRIFAALFPNTLGRSLADFERLPYAFLLVFGFIFLARGPILQFVIYAQRLALQLAGSVF